MGKVKIATLGSATFDVFLTGESVSAKRDVRTHDFVEQFPLGAKIEIERVVFSTGGGAANAAVTFARQGMETAFLGKIADDFAGREILKTLKAEGVRIGMVRCELEGMSGYSTLLLTPSGERTVLVYRGVSEDFDFRDFDFKNLEADWLYISSVSGDLEFLDRVSKWAEDSGTRIAYNPGSKELAHPELLRQLLPRVQVLLANKEEIRKLYQADTLKTVLRQAAADCQYVVVTDGPKGSWATDGTHLYRSGMYKDVPVADRTGAGDAFGSGFVAALARGDSLDTALTFASANSTAVVQHIGAKAGILKSGVKLARMPVAISKL